MTGRAALLLLAWLVSAFAALAVEPDEKLADPALEARARAVTQELRCVVCQNQSVDDSDAPLAHDIRVLVRERIAAGDSDEEARDFIVARYGDYVLLKPPFTGSTLILWLAPGAVLIAAFALAFFYVRRLNRVATSAAPLSAAEEESIARMVKGEDS